jgi:hypothetical protein
MNTTPTFRQPTFNEGNVTPDPTRFKTSHPSDKAQYEEIKNLLKKEVVGFRPSRLPPDGLYKLESAFGPHGPEIVKRIKRAGKIVFHSAGASNEGKYGNEIRVSDQVTNDCRTSDTANRAAFFYHLGTLFTTSESRNTTTISFTILFGTIRVRFSRFPETTIRSSFQRRAKRMPL